VRSVAERQIVRLKQQENVVSSLSNQEQERTSNVRLTFVRAKRDGSCAGRIAMIKLDDRTFANMDVVLEEVCRGLSASGGDHESRRYIAMKLVQAAKRGNTTLGGLEVVARRALNELAERKSA
jgi:hypothetical protein